MVLDPKWTQTMNDGVTNAAWDIYDSAIQVEVNAYNFKFLPTTSATSYRLVDWKMCKAMVWVESGGANSPAWTGRVMQIGNPGDKGLKVLRQGTEGSLLIMSPQLAIEVKTGRIDDPILNLRAGIAYLFTRMAMTDIQSVPDPTDSRIYSYTVGLGDNLDRIAAVVGTTVAMLVTMNPDKAKVVFPRDVLKYRKASMQRVIVGWLAFTSTNIANRYNVGDPSYAAKLDYVLDLFTILKRQSQPATKLPPSSQLTSDPVSTKSTAP